MRLSRPFLCPHCGTELSTPPIYAASVMLCAFALPGIAGYWSGLRGVTLLIVAVVAVFPASMLFMKIARTYVRPTLYPTDVSTNDRSS
jgi:hypothetical protein